MLLKESILNLAKVNLHPYLDLQDIIEDDIAEYNEGEELSQIKYTDHIGIMMSSIR